jgi:hypothetical protein
MKVLQRVLRLVKTRLWRQFRNYMDGFEVPALAGKLERR